MAKHRTKILSRSWASLGKQLKWLSCIWLFCSTTGKICINQKLLTLAKAICLIFYDSKIHIVFFHMEEPLEQHWQQLGYCGLTWLVWKMDQLCSEQGRPLGPCLGAVTWSYLCPGGYQNSMTAFKHQKKGSNIIQLFRWVLKVLWAQPSLLCL